MIGHEHIRNYLTQQLETQQLTHAYLFTGPQHVGKTLMAEWFASSLLCHGAQSNSLFGPATTQKPCQQCPSCQSITKSIHPDLYRLHLAADEQSISIESMRTFLKGLTTSPSLGQQKVAILNDAHALTTAAANAFLKTLEEATASTIILIISHQPHKLLPTILSRCQIVEFQKVTQPDEALQNDPLWQAARGLPGQYIRYKEAGENPDAQEKTFFQNLLRQSPGERFLAIDPLFKKTPAHAEKKTEWKQRLHIWQTALEELFHETLHQQTSGITPRQCQLCIDQLYRLQEAAAAPINLRAHVEGFLASIPRVN